MTRDRCVARFCGRKAHFMSTAVGVALAWGAAPAWAQSGPPTSAPTPAQADDPATTDAQTTQVAQAEQSTSSPLGDVIVTARRVNENLQKVPIAVTAIDSRQITRQAIIDPVRVQFASPSVQSNTVYNRIVGGYAVRGIANTGSYFAEVSGGPTTIQSAPFYDLDSVQILNGPQGTLFGRSNIGGAALFEPKRPQYNTFGGHVGAIVGGLGLNRQYAAVNIPIVDDHLAIRIAGSRYHLNGFTRVIGTNDRLNETNNFAGRIGIAWKADRIISNYTLLDYVGVRQTSAGWVLRAYNPNIASFNLPTSISAPNGLAVGTANFGSACTAAVAAGLQSSVTACIDQRLQLAATFLPKLRAEYQRVEAGGNAALRYTGGPLDAGVPLKEYLNQFFGVNQTLLDFGDIGPTTLSIKNILGVQAGNGTSGWQIDGIGGTIFSALSGGGGSFFYSNSGNQNAVVGGRAQGYSADSPYVKTTTDELQVRGVIGEKLLSWNLGGFYSYTGLPKNLSAIQNIARTNGGIYQPAYGFVASFNFQNGGYILQKAVYTQETLDLGWLVPFIDGLRLTGGYRYTWDKTLAKFRLPILTTATGRFTPGAALPDRITESSGSNTTVSLDAQINSRLLVYLASRTAYIPGGINTVVGGEQIPNYRPTFSPQRVTDYELGIKSDFKLGPASVRLNAAAYQLDFKDIVQLIFASVTEPNGATRTATFSLNAAAARMRGLEFQGQFAIGDLSGGVNYAYTDARFVRFEASDPLGLIGVGNPRCLSSSPAGQCLLDLSNSAFPNIPKHKVNGSLTYTIPMAAADENIALTASAAYQTRRYFGVQATRNIEAFGPSIGLNAVRESQGQGAYAILNFRADWANVGGSRFTLSAFVNNATNKNYSISSVSVLQSLGTAVNLYGDPRTFGLEGRFDF